MSFPLDPRQLLTSGAALVAGAAIQALGGFLAQLVLMRLLFPEDFGRFAVVLAGCGLVQTLLSLRLNILIIRHRDIDMTPERVELYRAALTWEIAASLAATLAWLIPAGLLDARSLCLVLSLGLAQWTNTMASFYERRMAYGPITVVETGSQVAGHAFAVAAILLGLGPATLYLREAVVALSRLAAFRHFGALSAPVLRLPRRGELRALAGEVRGFWLEGVSDSGFARLVVLATGGLGGMYGAGLFAQSQRLALIPNQLLAPVLGRLSANAFSRSDEAGRRRLLRTLVRGSLAVLALLAMAAVAFADPVVPWLFGAHWAPAADILVAMTGIIIFFPAFELMRAYCLAMGAIRILLTARLVQFAVFAAGIIAAALLGGDVIRLLAWSLSASYAAAFAVSAGYQARRGA